MSVEFLALVLLTKEIILAEVIQMAQNKINGKYVGWHLLGYLDKVSYFINLMSIKYESHP